MKRILYIIAVVLVLYSCEDNDYLVDGGVSSPRIGSTTFEYLKNHNQLDTLALLIEKAGLKDDVNGTTTLFAPNNLSIRNYVNKVLAEMRKLDPQAEFTVNDIPVDTLTKYLGGYIFNEKIKREDMVEEGKIYTATNGMDYKISLESTTDYDLGFYVWYVYFTFKEGDEWDESNDVSSEEKDMKVQVRTSNLESVNGVIHVLQGNHILFNYDPED